jgi:hypothetical protein
MRNPKKLRLRAMQSSTAPNSCYGSASTVQRDEGHIRTSPDRCRMPQRGHRRSEPIAAVGRRAPNPAFPPPAIPQRNGSNTSRSGTSPTMFAPKTSSGTRERTPQYRGRTGLISESWHGPLASRQVGHGGSAGPLTGTDRSTSVSRPLRSAPQVGRVGPIREPELLLEDPSLAFGGGTCRLPSFAARMPLRNVAACRSGARP